MKTEKLQELIANSDLPKIQQNVLNGFIERASIDQQKKHDDIELIQRIGIEKRINEVVLSTDEVKIYTINGTDDCDIKYPYRSIYLDSKGNWTRSSTVSPTLDTAYLVYLEYKHLGANSQFSDFAIKMLGIKIEE